jgi:hypothetical protein
VRTLPYIFVEIVNLIKHWILLGTACNHRAIYLQEDSPGGSFNLGFFCWRISVRGRGIGTIYFNRHGNINLIFYFISVHTSLLGNPECQNLIRTEMI